MAGVGRGKVAPLGVPEVVPIGSIRPAPNNPRKITAKAVEMVARSLKEFGWQQPILVDADGEIVAGHTRHKAAKLLKLTKVPVIRTTGLTPAQVRAYRVADNRTADFTTWDFPELARELEEIGDDFNDVLGIADWGSIMADYDATISGSPLTDEENTVTDETFSFTVVTFTDEATAREAAMSMFGIEGVVDVRDKR
jgi:hypothetical protein